jgi:hypothetical protein
LEAFLNYLQKNGGFYVNVDKSPTFILEDFFREIEAFSSITRLFKYIFIGIEAFLK